MFGLVVIADLLNVTLEIEWKDSLPKSEEEIRQEQEALRFEKGYILKLLEMSVISIAECRIMLANLEPEQESASTIVERSDDMGEIR